MSRDQIDNTPTSIDSSASSLAIRDADERDLPAINAIFNREITESAYVYAEVPITLDDRRAWLQMHRSAGMPVVVAIDPGDAAQILGWASLSPYRAASGYRFTLEASVYVSRAAHRRGIGRRLVATIDDAARARGVHPVVASIDSENAPSIALFERFGYVEAARLPEVGRKFDQWRTQLLLLTGFLSLVRRVPPSSQERAPRAWTALGRAGLPPLPLELVDEDVGQLFSYQYSGKGVRA